jgi:hypothetical protein
MKVTRYYPLSLSGTVLFGIALFLTANGAWRDDAYSLLAGITGIIFTIITAAVCKVIALHLGASEFDLVFDGTIYAKRTAILRASCRDWKPGLFCRLHLHLYGKIKAGNGSYLRYSEEFSSDRRGIIEAPVYLPLSGQFEAKVVFIVRDMFGISRAITGYPVSRSLAVVPPSYAETKSTIVDVSKGEEHKDRQRQGDDERYYMREYAPGDRMRDINWKSSSRLNQLITRISPETKDKTMILDIEYRPFHPYAHETLRTIALAQFLKSWVLTFLHQAKEASPNLSFRIWTAGKYELIEDDEGLESFAERFASVFPSNETSLLEYGKGSWYVFSTSLDQRLKTALTGREDAKVFVVSDSPVNALPYPVLGPFSPAILPGIWILRFPWTSAQQKPLQSAEIQAIKIRAV